MTIDDIADHMTRMHEFDYEECYEAIHAFCSLNHTGQFSELYRMLSTSDFIPGPMWSESRVEQENMAFDLVQDAIETYVEFPTDDDDSCNDDSE
jgi:hypothetical protein